MPAPQTEVLITVDGVERARHALEPGEHVIGREADCHIRIEADLVSPRHARLTLTLETALIEDLGSRDGTRVNGRPVTGSTVLTPGQKIQVGAATIELRRLCPESSLATVLIPAAETGRSVLPPEILRGRKYEIGGVVARGGMGAILDATEATTGRTVAMKVMLDSTSPEDRQRFLTEAKITALLEHPSIVPVYELSVEENGQIYYTMQFVKGVTLRKVLEQLANGDAATVKKFPLPSLLTIFQKVCDALAFAHSKQIIHRDLKPENIMLGDFGSVLVMDWGLAKRIADTGNRKPDSNRPDADGASEQNLSGIRYPQSGIEATLAGTVMGTPQYMAPEQARGEVDTLDHRADIYALGGILYHILAHRPAVTGQTAMEVVAKVARGEFAPLPNAGHPDSLVAVVHKAMALDRNQRYASVADLQADIAAYQGGFATSAERAGLARQLFLAVMRHKVTTAAALITLLTGIGFGTKAIVEGRRAEREAVRANAEALRAGNEAARANRALADLKATAPGLRDLADSEAGFQRFDSALNKLDGALILDPAHLPGYWRRAWLLVGMERFAEAADAIRLAQQKDPANEKPAAILPMIEQMAAAPEADRWNQDRASALLAHLQHVGASAEIVALSRRLQLAAAGNKKLVDDRLKQWRVGGSITATGGISVQPPHSIDTVEPLRGLPITDLNLALTRVTDLAPLRGMPLRSLGIRKGVTDISPLRGMPLQVLSLGGASVSDLSALNGMPLRFLKAGGSKVSDLAPLRGMQLECLALDRTDVRDLSPLEGMRLQILFLSGTQVSDLSPLQGMPLEELNARTGFVKDLSPLRGMPLKKLTANSNDFSPLVGMELSELNIATNSDEGISTLRDLTVESLIIGSGPVRDLKPLIGLGVRVLNINNSKNLRDLTPLLECTELEELTAMNCPASIEPLRAHPTLKIISYSTPGTAGFIGKPVEQFWKEYDAQQAAGKK